MHQFQRVRVFLIKINTGNAGVMHLLEELLQISTAFVIHPGIRKKPASIAVLKDTDTLLRYVLPRNYGFVPDRS